MFMLKRLSASGRPVSVSCNVGQACFRKEAADQVHGRHFPSVIRLDPRLHRYRSLSNSATRRKEDPGATLWNENIPFEIVRLVVPGDGIRAPAPLKDLLSEFDRTKFSIQLVDSKKDPPICKLMPLITIEELRAKDLSDRQEVYRKERESRRKVAASSQTEEGGSQTRSDVPKPFSAKILAADPKEIHLSWSSTPHDASHKYAKAKQIFSRGGSVTVVIGRQKKGTTRQSLTQEMKQKFMNDVKQALEDVADLKGTPTVNQGRTYLAFEPRPPKTR